MFINKFNLIRDKVSNYTKTIIILFLLIMFSFLSVGSFIITLNHINYESRSCANNLLLETNQIPYVILGFVVLSLIVIWLTALLTKKEHIKTRTILWITLVYVLILSVGLNLLLRNGVDFDQMHVLNFAKEVAYGNYWGLYKGQYMSAFPYLFGFAIYEMIVIKLLNLESVEQCILILQLLNCIELTITVFFGYKIIEKIYNKRFALISYCLLTISFLPIFLYTSFIYNEIISFMFIYIALYFVLDFFDSSKLISAFISILSISLAVIMRLNSLIMLIAIILVIIYKCIFSSNNHKHLYIYIMFAVLMLVAVYLLTKVPIKYFEKASNYYGIVDKNEYRLDEGMPYIGNIAMGTRIKHFDYYGWYDGTNSYVYITQCNFDTEKATIEYKKIIDESLRYACKNPDMAVDFLLKKTESIWMDPIFDVLYFTGFNRTNDSALSNYLYYGSGKDLFKYFSDIYQSTVYVFCLLSIAYKLKNVKKTKIETLIVPIITLGGFLFLLFWEASARYTLPYFFMSIMCAADGLCCVYDFLLKKRNRNIKA